MSYITDTYDWLLSQYKGCPRMVAVLALLSSEAMRSEAIFGQSLSTLLDIDIQTGRGLDVIGWIVGISRILPVGIELDDANYRKLIRMRIRRNHAKGNLEDMIVALSEFFETPVNVQTDNHGTGLGLSISYSVSLPAPLTAMQQAILDANVWPLGMGVQISARYFNAENVFGFDDDPTARGFDPEGTGTDPGGYFVDDVVT
jgi:hypothetical protein